MAAPYTAHDRKGRVDLTTLARQPERTPLERIRVLIVAHYSRLKLAAIVIGSVAFVASGLWLARDPDAGAYQHFIGWGGALFFGATGLRALRSLPNRSIVLRIDDEGVFDGRAMVKPIPWSVVSSVSEIRLRSTTMFVLRLNEPAEPFMKPSAFRPLLKINKRSGYSQFSFTATPFKISTKTLRAALAARVPIA